MRGVTVRHCAFIRGSALFQLTRLMRGVTAACSDYDESIAISTHTPHARRDVVKNLTAHHLTKFQLTRLMRGVTSDGIKKLKETSEFQLTRLMRGVTRPLGTFSFLLRHFNSHASCEA